MNEELTKLFLDYRAKIIKGESCDLRKDYIAKAIPLISAEARKQAYMEVGEALCQRIGEVMLDDMEEGQKLGNYLRATLKVIQERAGITFKEGGKEAE